MQSLNRSETKRFLRQARKEYKRDKHLALVLENIQYARNVAGIFRTADAVGVRTLYLTGISQQPPFGKELRQASRAKEDSVSWKYEQDTLKVISILKKQGFFIVALEIAEGAMPLEELPRLVSPHQKICLVVGNEAYGVTKNVLAKCDAAVFIPMFGKAGSLNVGVSTGIALYGMGY